MAQNLEDICDVFIEVVRWMQYIQKIQRQDIQSCFNPLNYWDSKNDSGSGKHTRTSTGTASWATAKYAKHAATQR